MYIGDITKEVVLNNLKQSEVIEQSLFIQLPHLNNKQKEIGISIQAEIRNKENLSSEDISPKELLYALRIITISLSNLLTDL